MDFDPASAQTAPDPEALAMMRAYAAALRGQNDQGMILGLAHNKAFNNVGGEMMGQAQHGMDQLAAMPGQRLKLATEQQQMQQSGPQAALGGTTPANFHLLTQAAAVPKYAPNPMTGALYNTRTGQSQGGGGMGLSPEAIDQAAHAFSTTGALPRMPFGRAGALLTQQIVNRAAELHPEADLAGNRASYGADTSSLKNLTKQSDAMSAFEGTALKNLDQFLGVAHSVVDTGSPLFNAPARAFMQSVAGDPKMAQFAAARNVAVQEISKVLGGSLGGSAVSDSARHEASSLIGPDMSLAQIEAVAKILKTDMANRRASLTEQIGAVRGRTSGKAPVQAEASPAPAAAPAPTPAQRKSVGGKTYEKRPDGWYEVTGG